MEATGHIQFFQNYIKEGRSDIHFKCCQAMKHEYNRQGDVVFHIGILSSFPHTTHTHFSSIHPGAMLSLAFTHIVLWR